MHSVAELIKITAAEEGSCDSKLARQPWSVDRDPAAGYGPGASAHDPTPVSVPYQQPLPTSYTEASEEELRRRIIAAKAALGERVRILGHFYQRDEVIEHADDVGDSFMLAQAARKYPQAEAFVFCGVHFMAETADILSRREQAVILPNLAAGCSMADMASLSQVQQCFAELSQVLDEPPIPVTYMNSAADIKAFCGRNGGIVCTSSNAATVLEWAFARGQRVVFFPDQHLGRNTARHMGIPEEFMPLWRPGKTLGGNTREQLQASKVILWNGFCSVHRRFTVAQIERARKEFPGVRVIVHPECPAPVVEAADGAGSTDYLRKQVAASAAGDTIAIGTEINLVNRLQAQYPDRTIFCLDPVVCPCSTMYRIHPAYLAWTLEALLEGTVLNRVSVAEDIAADARIALERMLEAKP